MQHLISELKDDLKTSLWFRHPTPDGYEVAMKNGYPERREGVVVRNAKSSSRDMQLGGFSVLSETFTVYLFSENLFLFDTEQRALQLNDQGVQGLDNPSEDDVRDARVSILTIMQIDTVFGVMRLLCDDTTRRIT